MHDLLLNRYSIYGIHITHIIQGSLWLSYLAVTLLLCRILYKTIRCKFPITVNCWFCNKNATVPYENANCWDCPNCGQYNGFTQDGGYNKVIQEQHTPSLNTVVYNSLKSNIANISSSSEVSNGFCKLCNINQHLKIQQLALFSPIDEDNYDYEIEKYREQLENSYRLCAKCETTLEQTLQKQQYNILKDRLNSHRLNTELLQKHDRQQTIIIAKHFAVSVLKWISAILSTWLLFTLTVHLEKRFTIIYSSLPNLFILLPTHPFLQDISEFFNHSYQFNKEVSAIGFACYLLSSYSRQDKIDFANLLFWGTLHALSWTDLAIPHALTSLIACCLNWQGLSSRNYYFFKKTLTKKLIYQPEKLDYSFVGFTGELPRDPKPVLEKTEIKITPPRMKNCNEKVFVQDKQIKEPERQIEDSELKKTTAVAISAKRTPPNATPMMRTRKQTSLFNKNFLAELENKANERESSPPPEIYNDLIDLHLGTNKDKSNKPSNFLFENYNFGDKNRNGSSIIKPAKFVKSPVNSWTYNEPNVESVSRSSTPSSGYSSQKAEKPERHSFEYTKAVTPISVTPYSRTTPPDNFDYYNANPGMYGHVNYFPPGFVPFQQFPGPMGHTTVYTYTRPTNFPYPFPSQNPHDFRYSPMSPRFSDVSATESENLFQNTSQTYQLNKKWLKFKSILYNASIFLNVLTVLALGYSVCLGLVDWKWPQFGFQV